MAPDSTPDDPRARLDQLEAELREALKARDLAADGDERSDGHHHPAEAATDAEYREKQLRDTLKMREQLEEIQRARAALDAGTYGVCIDCGGEIPPGRLKALPDAKRCVPCQNKAPRRG